MERNMNKVQKAGISMLGIGFLLTFFAVIIGAIALVIL